MFSYQSAGIKLTDSQFWLDAHRKVPFSFVSHGHTDHLKNHDKILATPATIKFHALRAKQKKAVSLEFNKTIHIDGYSVQLYPAGHILGSAMIWLERDGISLLYTGDFKMQQGWTAEPIEIPEADILIMESTFGHPAYKIQSSREDLKNQLVHFITQSFRQRKKPVVLAYSLGKAQEAMKILGDMELSIRVQKSAWDLARIYEDFGISFTNCKLWQEDDLNPDEVLIFPPHLCRHEYFRAITGKRTVFLSGWANRSNGFRVNSDHAIAMSDHADFDELLEFVKKVNPKKVFTTHGFNDFPKHISSIGYKAQVLEPDSQTILF